ncbi:MAG TPA: sigma 54-interacting transcriptional regulator [Negativicutes bacterium]|nr:sigma 54-interacting transcriptional regulator [Negativicutes bacterium]
MKVRDLMSKKLITLNAGVFLSDAARIFCENNIDGAPVVDDDGMVIGLLTKTHLIQSVAQQNDISAQRVCNVMTSNVVCLKDTMMVQDLQQNNLIFKYGRFPVVNSHNRPIGFVTRTDLVRYLSEKSVSMAEEFEAVLNSASNGVMAINAAGIVTIFNPAAQAITGMKAEKVIGRSVNDVIPNSPGLMSVLETGALQMNLKVQFGTSQIITKRSPIIKNNKIVGAVAIFQDVTELQKVASELEEVKNLKSTLDSIVNSIFDCIVVVDKNGYIVMMNEAYGEFLHTDPQKAIGKHITDVIENTRMHIVAQTGKPEICDMQKIGEHNTVVTRIPIVKDGEVTGAVGKMVFRDVKDLRVLARKLTSLQLELEYYKEELQKVQGGKYTIESIIGSGEKIQWLKMIALRAAKGKSTVLITGESGTGKELFAQAIHYASGRQHGPFIKINCAAIPENLLEAELFGYEDGAFTGARKGGKPGKFELANGGTIFLDEIGDMSMPMQSKLLRVLQEREIERVGGTKTSAVDVRVIAATNQDLEAMMSQGTFRQDLYYRLNIIALHIPPLRERREDLPELCEALLRKINRGLQFDVDGISKEAMVLLAEYEWPGNVRELENVLERSVNLMDEVGDILPEHLPPTVRRSATKTENANREKTQELAGIMEDAEKQAIYKALETAGGNRSQAAKILGIHRSGFYQKLSKYQIKL